MQYSVYEVKNTERVINNLRIMIDEEFAKHFTPADSVVIYDVSDIKMQKYGNAIHRDKDIVFFWMQTCDIMWDWKMRKRLKINDI